MAKKKGLGRGLSALIEDPGTLEEKPGAPLEIRVEVISPNPMQPRRGIRDKDLKSLADSIKDHGVLEPLVARRLSADQYELIAGERRLRAARAAGLKRVPVIIRDAAPQEMLEFALIENLHREDLNPMDEAESYQRLVEEFSRTQEEVARVSGRDRSTVANLIRLLALPEPVQKDVRTGRLTAGHARALLALTDESRILAARERVLSRGLSVRETEALVKRGLAPARKKAPPEDDVYYRDLSGRISRALGSKVRIVHQGRRRLEISYASVEELERLLKRLGVDAG